jgi:ribonuclease Z
MLEKVMKPQLDFYCKDIKYPLFFHSIDASKHCVIFEDNTITVETLPLNHRMPCCGFLFREKPKRRHLIGDVANFYNIPAYMRQAIKEGADYTTPDGEVIPNSRLTREPDPSRSYAYCSDTAPCTHNNEALKDVDLLYHEATFADSEEARARATFHSTARQAATIAKEANVKRLVIGHFSSRYTDETILSAQAKEIFPCTELADENIIYHIK